MAASPVAVDRGDTQVREKWPGKEDRPGDSLAHGADLPASNGGPPDERGASDPVSAEYHPRSPSAGDPGPGTRSSGATIYREKHIKVLRSSLVLCFVSTTYVYGQRAWRDFMLFMAGFLETSYPLLRVHMLRSCSMFTLFSVLVLVFTFCALQPNKVYIGGLPENTRQEDLQSCFGKIGDIVNIELKYVSP